MQSDIARLLPTKTLGQLVLDSISRFGDRPMISDGIVTWTYGELGDAIGRYMAVMSNLGLNRGDGIAMLSSNRAEVWAVLCAANLLGLRYTPMHPMAAEDDHSFIARDADICALVVDPDFFANRAEALTRNVPNIRVLISLGPCKDAVDIVAAAQTIDPLPLADHADSADIPYLPYTGGTTGRSKGVMLSHRSLVTMTTIIAAEWEWPAIPRYALVTPMSHAGGINLYPIMFQGGYARTLRGWDVETFCATVEKERLNSTFLVPTLINALVDAADVRSRFDLSSLELVVYGAAPMSPDRMRRALEIFGAVFLQLYGQSECPQVMTTLRKVDHDLSQPQRLGSCGLPVSLIEIRLFDSAMNEVEIGEPGEICARSPMLMDGYWRAPELTEQAFSQGWLHTGDIGVKDKDGYLYIVDRTKDMIISGGFNIYPREVEDTLMSHPAVSLAAVIGIPDPHWGEAVKAFVTLHPGMAAGQEELQAHVKAKRGAPWSPKSIDFMEVIPLTGLGKIDRKALREPYWQGLARSVA